MANYLEALLEDDNIGLVILEANLVKDSDGFGMGMGIYKSQKDTNFEEAPYIKVFDGPDPDHCTKLARIDLKEVKYVIHYKDSSNPKKWKLNTKEKKQLNELMRAKGKGGRTNWENVVINLANFCDKPISHFRDMFPENGPDFTKLP